MKLKLRHNLKRSIVRITYKRHLSRFYDYCFMESPMVVQFLNGLRKMMGKNKNRAYEGWIESMKVSFKARTS